MTGGDDAESDMRALSRILGVAEALLLDFDGPVCSVFAGFPARVVAAQLREVLTEDGHTELPPWAMESDDPFDVLSYAASLGQAEARYVETALRAHEVEAVQTATPTSGAHDLMRAWHTSGRSLAIVSNNSAEAVRTYLALHDLSDLVEIISSRTQPDPALLKPAPHLVDQAVQSLGIPPALCAFIGDSISDIAAGHAAGVKSVGYANKPGKREAMRNAKAEIVVSSLATEI